MALPERNAAAEDAYVLAMSDNDDMDLLIEAIEAAISARRPMLSARLVNLLGEQVEIEPGSALAQAQRAAGLVILARGTPEDRSWSELEDAWRNARKNRMHRIRHRMRERISGKPEGRLDRHGRRRR